MHPSRPGWWASDLLALDLQRDDVNAPIDYRISLDDGPPRPDPRSPHQPHGVHGPSRSVDHSAFVWSDQHFQARPLSSAVLYELHVGTFSPAGTFDGAIQFLDHLVRLGITHVELLPIAEFPGKYGWGYDGVCCFAPASIYGGPDGLKRLVNACHQRGLAVILDVVYNHLGPVANHLAEFGPYFSDTHRTPWGKGINIDGEHSDEVRRFFCDNAQMWLRDYHIDGLRLDAVHAIVDTTAYPFLEQLADEVQQLEAHLGRHLVLIAESDLNDPRLVRPREAGGLGLDAQWSDDFHHALHTALTDETRGYYVDFDHVEHLASAMTHPFIYTGQRSLARQRSHGRIAHGVRADRFVAYAQNHDQIGNRAKGERLGHLVGQRRAEIAAALVLTSPYVPLLFQGEEWNTDVPFLYFADWRDEPELAKAVEQGRLREFEDFGWRKDELANPISEQTFQACKLDWHARDTAEHARMLRWYQQLIALRKALFDLTDSRLENCQAQADARESWLRVQRGSVLTVVSLAESPRCVPIPPGVSWQIALANAPVATSEMTEHVRSERAIDSDTIALSAQCIHLPADSVAVLCAAPVFNRIQASIAELFHHDDREANCAG